MNKIEVFLKASTFAVAGASQDRSKYGNKVYRAIIASGRTAYPLNPNATEVEGGPAFASIANLPVVLESLSIVTPPQVTRQVIQQAIAAGVKNIGCNPEQKIPKEARPLGMLDSTSSTMEVVYLSFFPSNDHRSRGPIP